MAKRYHTAKHAVHPPTDNLPLERLREAVRRMGGVTAVATMADIPVSSMSGYIYGREMKLSAAMKIARVCSVSIEWLAGVTEHPEFSASNQKSDGANEVICRLPFFDTSCFANQRNSKSDIPKVEIVSISRNLLDRFRVEADALSVVAMSGDSMEPTLRDGDLVLVETTPNEAVSGLHVIMINGRITVRRVAYPIAGGATLIADNKLYPSQDIGSDQLKWGDPRSEYPAVVIGRVIYRFQAI